MKPSLFPDHLQYLWGKSAVPPQQDGESLAYHTWQVLSRFADLVRIRPGLADYFGTPQLWQCLYWACFLHDFGKAAKGFQAMLRTTGLRWGYRHEVLSLAFLDWIAPDLSEVERQWIVAAIVSHHRDAHYIMQTYDEDMEPDPVATIVAELDAKTIADLWVWMAEYSSPWIDTLQLRPFGVTEVSILPKEQAMAAVLQNGGKRVYSWLAVYRRFLRSLQTERNLHLVAALVAVRGLITTADHAGSAHVSSLPMGVRDSWELLGRRCFPSNESYWTPHEHQIESAKRHGSSSLLIAPTGSGKTEAALFWALGDGQTSVPRIFYTLPYQASMNAMYDRLRDSSYFGEDAVGLQHGKTLQALYQRLLTVEEGDPAAVSSQASWKRNLTKLHAYPVKVFSPYQMLKTVYQIKGFEGMLTDYMQAAFIFDEIHAYDPARLALILGLVKYLHEYYGAHFFIMSATFPAILRKTLSEILGEQQPVVAETGLFQKFQRHKLCLLHGDLIHDGIEAIIEDVQKGKSVLVCCNSVRRAQMVQEILSRRLPADQVELLHSRLIFQDRFQRESRIRERCKIRTAQDRQMDPLVVVATQVVEVSLNIDLDTIYTDPAPLDALIQRFGRINRACNKGIVPVHVFHLPNHGQYVYDDWLVQKTIEVLEKHAHEPVIDEAKISDWLDDIYADEQIKANWQKAYQQQQLLVSQILRHVRPFSSNEESERTFEKLFDGIEVLPACFEQTYRDLIQQQRYLEASYLFVGITQKKSEQLLRKRKLQYIDIGFQKIPVVSLAYHPIRGLLFDSTLNNIPDGD